MSSKLPLPDALLDFQGPAELRITVVQAPSQFGAEEDHMIEDFFEHPYTLRYLRGGLTGPHIDAFAAVLAEQGFTVDRARGLLRGVAHLGHWLKKRRAQLTSLDEGLLEAFRAHLSRCRCVRRNKGRLDYCRSGSNRFLTWARERGVVATATPAQQVPLLIQGFEEWMIQHRNVVAATLSDCYRLQLQRFLDAVGDDPGRFDAAGIRSFVLAQSQRTRCSRAKQAVTAVRMLLRYLAIMGRCAPELVDAVPTVAHWRLGALPRYLSGEVVDQIIASCDPETARGRRDRAVLLLLARLGLRAGDVARLRLGDLDWPGATIAFVGKGRREARLPLAQEVGDAILAWLSSGRPDGDDDHVFFGLRAPIGPLSRSSVATVVARAARRTDATMPRVGPHMLRHSAATAWLREGMALPTIGALLRHRSPETTAIYAKVDTDLLSTVARPWPEEVSP